MNLGQIIGQIRFRLSGLGAIEDAQAELKDALDVAAIDVTVDEATGFSAGVVEIDFELMRVKKVDPAGILHLPAYGRGYKGSTATAHTAGSEVTFNPLWPRSVIATEVNGVLAEVYPDLYAVREYEGLLPTDSSPLPLPDDAVGVISVWLASGTTGEWVPVDHWSYDPHGGRSLRLGVGRPGQETRVLYASRPGQFSLTSANPLAQDFAAATGLPDRVADLIALGVAYRLASLLPLAALRHAGAEARADAQSKPADGMNASARLLYSEFRARVQAEQMALVKEHPIRLHKAR